MARDEFLFTTAVLYSPPSILSAQYVNDKYARIKGRSRVPILNEGNRNEVPKPSSEPYFLDCFAAEKLNEGRDL
jgi:hypothetical protein